MTRTEDIQGTKTFRTHHAQTYILEKGVVLVDRSDSLSLCIRLEPEAALQHAEYVLAHRTELEQLQRQLEETWRQVALEVQQRFEAENEDGEPFSEAIDHDIRVTLERVAGVDTQGRFTAEPTSPAGRWYRSMWNEDGKESTTYEQQWTPFLRICRKVQLEASDTLGKE